MKLTKMSLVAALLVGSSAFAIDNVKVSGDANLYYSTTDAKAGYAGISQKDDLFGKDNSAADASINLNVTADLAKNDLVTVSAGAGYTIISTLGLENNFVSNVWGGSHTATLATGSNFANTQDAQGAKVENANWMTEAWVALSLNKLSKSTLKLGRMELDTPLAFTEKWSIEKNTFEAAVLINKDLPDTTVVAAYVGNGNGNETFGTGNATTQTPNDNLQLPSGSNMQSNVQTLGLAVAPVVNGNGDFTTYGTNGAYAFGLINNSFKPLTVQAWYYDLPSMANAYWLQADLKCQKVPGLIAGVQYEGVTYKKGLNVPGVGVLQKDVDSGVYALMVGYEVKDLVTVKLAYSSVDKDFNAGFNTATNYSTAQSKLYTEAWWNYGHVTMADTTAYNVTIEAPVKDVADFGLYYTYADHDKKVSSKDLTEVTLTASKSFGPLDTTVAYIYTDLGKNIDATNTIQAYLTLNF